MLIAVLIVLPRLVSPQLSRMYDERAITLSQGILQGQ
jgi:hypothetical protein